MGSSGNLSHPSPSVSVITTIKKGGTTAFLSSLDRQRYKKPFEVIVVEGGNRSQARNLGVSCSKAQLTLFIDADCEAPDNWLKNIAASLPNDPTVAGVGGVSSRKTDSPSLEKAIDSVYSTYIGSLNSPSLISFPKDKRYYVKAISTHNCLFRKDALTKVGGFDNRFELNEDTDLCSRLRKNGYKLILDQNIFVYHRRREAVKDFAKQFFWYGVGRMRSMFTDRRYIDKRILALFLGTVFVSIISPLLPPLLLSTLLSYFLIIIGESIIAGKRLDTIRQFPRMLILFAIEHFSYLIGLMMGIFQGPWREKKPERMRMTRYLLSSDISVRAAFIETLEYPAI